MYVLVMYNTSSRWESDTGRHTSVNSWQLSYNCALGKPGHTTNTALASHLILDLYQYQAGLSSGIQVVNLFICLKVAWACYHLMRSKFKFLLVMNFTNISSTYNGLCCLDLILQCVQAHLYSGEVWDTYDYRLCDVAATHYHLNTEE